MKGEGSDLPMVAFNKLVMDSEKTYGIPMFRLVKEPVTFMIGERVDRALKDNKPELGWGIIVEEVEVILLGSWPIAQRVMGWYVHFLN